MSTLRTKSLKSKAAKGMLWSTIGFFATYGIQFFVGIILARLLIPSDYGLIGMLAFFIALSELFINSGFSSALIQSKARTEEDFSTVFYYNLTVSIFLYLLLFITAPHISSFYDKPELVKILRVLSLNIIINSLSLTQSTKLLISIDFKKKSIVSIVSSLCGGFLGVSAAYSGYGVWSIVIQRIIAAIVNLILLFYFERWLPLFLFSRESFKRLFKYSSSLLITNFVATIVQNLYSLLIGKFFSPVDVGYYTKSKQYSELLPNTITSVLQGVSFPVLSLLQDERARLVSAYSKLMRMTAFFVIPVLGLFALVAEPFVRLVLTEKWLPIVSLIQWLCIARMVTPLSSLNMNILKAIGRSDLYMKVDISKLPLSIFALIIAVPLGLNAVVVTHTIISLLCFFINAYYPGRIFGFGAFQQIKEMRFAISASLVVYGIMFFVLRIMPNDLSRLAVVFPLGMGIYFFLARTKKTMEFEESKRMIFSMLEKAGLSIKHKATPQ